MLVAGIAAGSQLDGVELQGGDLVESFGAR
jgi:hypothetical protein